MTNLKLVGLKTEFLISHLLLGDGVEQPSLALSETFFSPEVLGSRLSKVTRWNGQFTGNTVAGHSLLVHDMVDKLTHGDPLTRLVALLHDASEAYLCDIPSPIKAMLPDYRILETRVMDLVGRFYRLPGPDDAESVKEAYELVAKCDKYCSEIECFTINESYMGLMGYAKINIAADDFMSMYARTLRGAWRAYNGNDRGVI